MTITADYRPDAGRCVTSTISRVRIRVKQRLHSRMRTVIETAWRVAYAGSFWQPQTGQRIPLSLMSLVPKCTVPDLPRPLLPAAGG